MYIKTISIREDDPTVTLTAYIGGDSGYTPDGMLVIPGGGYEMVCNNREGEPIALAYMSRGFNAFVLNYSVGKKAKFPQPLIDASLAMAYIKRHADEFHINPERVFVVGFSAGGHLSAMLGTMWNNSAVYENTDIKYGENKPCGMVLCYPVLTGKRGECHLGSFCNLIGEENPTDEQLAEFSLENRVSDETVPAFIMHTASDNAVPVLSPIYFAQALAKNNIKFEMHIYPFGEHGSALGTHVTSMGNPGFELERVSRWVDDSCSWIKEIF